MKGPQGIQSMGGDQATDMRNSVISDPMYVLGHFDAFPVQQLPGEEVEGQAANVVLVWISEIEPEETQTVP